MENFKGCIFLIKLWRTLTGSQITTRTNIPIKAQKSTNPKKKTQESDNVGEIKDDNKCSECGGKLTKDKEYGGYSCKICGNNVCTCNAEDK